MASSSYVADIKTLQSVTQKTMDLLDTLKSDISQAKLLTGEDRKNCEAIYQRAEAAYNQLKVQFLRETLVLINQALSTSDENVLREIHHAWSSQMDYVTRKCEHIAGPLLEVMRILSKSDEQIEKKYWCCLGGAMVSILLIGTALGFFIAYYYPDSFVEACGKEVILVGAGILASIVVATGYKKICSQRDGACKNESAQLVSTKPLLSNGTNRTQNSSASEFVTSMERSIATLNITEDKWYDREALEFIKKTVETQLKNLQNSV